MTHRFGVYFYAAGTKLNSLDIRFQEVSGLKASITTKQDTSVVSRLYRKLIPTGVEYGDLELRRGMVIGSKLGKQIQATFNDFTFHRSDVLLTIYSEQAEPMISYLFAEVYPIAWEVNSLNANTEDVLIENLRLTYSRVRVMSLNND